MRHAILVAAAVVLTVGCSDDSTGTDAQLTAQMKTDIATATGETVAGDVESMSRTDATASSSLFAFAGDFTPGSCTLSLGSFVCVTTMGNLDGQATITFRDATGETQDAYDANATASVDVETDINGSVSGSGYSLTFSRTGSFTVTGLAGTETTRTWNGDVSTDVSSSTFGGSRGYDLTATSHFGTVVVPANGNEPRWPTSGTVTAQLDYTMTSGTDTGATGSIDATVTFNGTAQVPLTVAGTAYTLDLASHTVTKVN